MLIIDVISISGLDLSEKVQLCKDRLRDMDPDLFPDTASPDSNVALRKGGFTVRKVIKDVLPGIEAVRRKLSPGPGSRPELFILGDDEGCKILIEEITKYHWKRDTVGNLTEHPEKVNDDAVDALRYLCSGLFGIGKGRVLVSGDQVSQLPVKSNWMQDEIRKRLVDDQYVPQDGKKGSFRWSF